MLTGDKQKSIETVTANEEGLREIYQKVFKILKTADRSKFKDNQRANVGMLDSSLDPPELIRFDKAVAVLKAILSHQSVDKIQLEDFFSVPAEGGLMVGQIIREDLRNLGVGLGDLQVFAKENGWIGER